MTTPVPDLDRARALLDAACTSLAAKARQATGPSDEIDHERLELAQAYMRVAVIAGDRSPDPRPATAGQTHGGFPVSNAGDTFHVYLRDLPACDVGFRVIGDGRHILDITANVQLYVQPERDDLPAVIDGLRKLAEAAGEMAGALSRHGQPVGAAGQQEGGQADGSGD